MNNNELIDVMKFLKKNYPKNFEELFTSFSNLVQNVNNANETVHKMLLQKVDEKLNDDEYEYCKKIKKLHIEIADIKRAIDDFDSYEQNEVNNSCNEISSQSNENYQNSTQNITYSNYNLNTNEVHYISEKFTNKKLYAFSFQDSPKTQISSWQKLYLAICEELIKQNPDKFRNLQYSIKGKTGEYFSYDSSNMRISKKLSNGMFIETNLSTRHITTAIRKILKEFDINESELKIYLWADYSALH